jgi:hypothetical protein
MVGTVGPHNKQNVLSSPSVPGYFPSLFKGLHVQYVRNQPRRPDCLHWSYTGGKGETLMSTYFLESRCYQ